MLDGLFGDSYEKFIKDLTPEGRAKVTEPVFNTIRSEVLKRMGTYKSRVYLGCLDRGIFNIYLWKGSFEPSEQVFESLKMQKKSKKDLPKFDVLIRLDMGRVDGKWKVFGFYLQ